MRNPRRSRILLTMVPALLVLVSSACGGRSRLLEMRIDAPSLQTNTVGLGSRQTVRIYLPPSYPHSQVRYPVLYFLPGYDDPVWIFTGGALQGFRMRDALDGLLAQRRIEEMIVVIPSGTTPLGGTFYSNSPVLGNWEDYVAGDLVTQVDRRFRTLARPEARAVAGTTSGGSGALLLAMHHPDIFGAVYALNPVLLHPGALDADGICSVADAGRYLSIQEATAALTEKQARLALKLYLQGQIGSDSEAAALRAFFITLGAAFSPNPSSPGLPVRLPYRRGAEGLEADPSARAAFESGLGDWQEKIRRYDGNLRSLRLLALDYGTGDSIRWLPKGCEHVAALLSAKGIPHRVLTHPGNHEDHFRERMEGFLLPILSQVLHAQ
jgi:enterochelin esterase-like enzyme